MLISEQAVSPVSGSRLWVLVDDRTMAIHPQAAAWATFLRGAGRSPNTIRSYLPRLGRFLNWTSARGLDWRRATVLDLAAFKQRLELTEVGGTGRRVTGKTVNASLVAVVEFYRFCAAYGYVTPDVAQRMSQPKFV
jgi:site-specific recombinase XerD